MMWFFMHCIVHSALQRTQATEEVQQDSGKNLNAVSVINPPQDCVSQSAHLFFTNVYSPFSWNPSIICHRLFPSCCSNLFMLNLDLLSLASKAFAFSCDLLGFQWQMIVLSLNIWILVELQDLFFPSGGGCLSFFKSS